MYDKTDVFHKHNAAQKKPDRIGITHVIIQKHSEEIQKLLSDIRKRIFCAVVQLRSKCKAGL